MPESSSSKRRIIENPFIKPENKDWSIADTKSFKRPISPPPSVHKGRRRNKNVVSVLSEEETLPETAAVEAGEAIVTDQLGFWSTKLESFERPNPLNSHRLSVSQWKALYSQHAGNTSGSHFIVHQHDHPVAGTHYDLRLQCNPTSSISFAIMYGLPGDPNSRRLNRNATETRVHCLWNHLIETASLSTGTMLIWDTGYYEVLPFKEEKASQETDNESDSFHSAKSSRDVLTEQQKLHAAFRSRKMRLKLYGTSLPGDYTISLRLTKDNYRTEQPGPPTRKRKRKAPALKPKRTISRQSTTSDSGSDSSTPSDMGPFGGGRMKRSLSSLLRHATPPPRGAKSGSMSSPLMSGDADPGGSDHEAEDQEEIRKNNAYPGATNDIGSIHQRKWYLSMDRRRSGFVPGRGTDGSKEWVRKRSEDGDLEGFERFHVLGRDTERSVVTGRLARDILEDEGVDGFVPRGLWKGVTE